MLNVNYHFKKLGASMNVDTNISPTTVNANSKYSFILYPTQRILNTDKIVITFPSQVVLQNGNRLCQAVNIKK